MLETTLKKSEEGRNDAVKEIEWFRKEQKQKEKKIKDLENNLEETTEKLNKEIGGLQETIEGNDYEIQRLGKRNAELAKKVEETTAKDEKIKLLEMLNEESEAKLEKMKSEYMADITSKNDLLERLNKSVAESETKFEKVKQEYEANYNKMLDISRKNHKKANAEMENKIEEIKEEYQARICSENCSEKIRALQDVVNQGLLPE